MVDLEGDECISNRMVTYGAFELMTKAGTAEEAVKLIRDDAVVAVNSSSGMCCPDAILKALGERFDREQHPRNLTTIHPIAAGDMFGTKGVDHIAKDGLLSTIIGGSYPSGPTKADPPKIWEMILANQVKAYNVPSGIVFDMLREASAKRPGVLTKIGMDTFVDPRLEGCAMNAAATASPIVRRTELEGEEWLYFPAIAPDVAIIRATTSDSRGNLTFEQEGAYLGALEMAVAAKNNGGVVIAQVKRVVNGPNANPHAVHVPGAFVSVVVEEREQWQTTATPYDPAISGEVDLDIGTLEPIPFDAGKVIARRVAQELRNGWIVNIGFGLSANVPRILIEENKHGAVTWVIEQGAIGGVPLLGFKFGCSANAEAFVPSPNQFSFFQSGGFDAALLSFLQVGNDGSVNVSRLKSNPHRTAGAGGFVDITSRAGRIIFSGYFNAGAKLAVREGRMIIEKEGKIAKFVTDLDQISFSGTRAQRQGQKITFITERCVIKLKEKGLIVTEVAPGIDIDRDILGQVDAQLFMDDQVKEMDSRLFHPKPFGLQL